MDGAGSSALASVRVRPAPGSLERCAIGLPVLSTWGASGLPRPACRAQLQTAAARELPLGRDLPTSWAIRVGVVHGVGSAVVIVFRCLHPTAFRRKIQGRGQATPMPRLWGVVAPRALDRVSSTVAASKHEMRVAGDAFSRCPPRLTRLYLLEDKPAKARRRVPDARHQIGEPHCVLGSKPSLALHLRRYRRSDSRVRAEPHKELVR